MFQTGLLLALTVMLLTAPAWADRQLHLNGRKRMKIYRVAAVGQRRFAHWISRTVAAVTTIGLILLLVTDAARARTLAQNRRWCWCMAGLPTRRPGTL